MEHPGPAAQEHLIEESKEVKVKRLITVEYDLYRIFKAVYQISRILRQA
jgi:CRISPR/Cas system-associated protein Cas5 (RAMP superfamily)